MRLLAAALATMLALSSIGCTPKVQQGAGIAFGTVGLASTIGGGVWCKLECHETRNMAGSLGMIAGGLIFLGLGAALFATASTSDPSPPPDPPPHEPTFSPPPM